MWLRSVRLPALSLAVVLATACSATQGSPVPQSTAVSSSGTTTTPTPTPSSAAPPSTTSSAASPSSGVTASDPAAPVPVPGGTVSFEGLPDEGVSGLVAVPGRQGAWFAVTDRYHSGDLLVLYVDGSHTSIPVTDLSARNLEALAAGPCEAGLSGTCLYLADIGDNDRSRDSILLTSVPVPDPALAPPALQGTTWEYTYPDGPHDAETLVVAQDGRIIVVTKAAADDPGHRVYVGAPGGGQLELRHTFDPPAPQRPLQSLLVGTVVTDAAWDGSRMLVLTYDQVLEYTAPSPDADPADFPTWPVRELPHPRLVQTEGIADGDDGCGYVVVSEGRGGPGTLVAASCGAP